MLADDTQYQTTSLQSLTQEGEKFYLEHLRQKLEGDHLGEYVIIDPESKDYFVDHDLLEALEKAEEKHPEKFFTIIKIGTFKQPTNHYKSRGFNAWSLS